MLVERKEPLAMRHKVWLQPMEPRQVSSLWASVSLSVKWGCLPCFKAQVSYLV